METPIWQASRAEKEASNIMAFLRFSEERTGLSFSSYDALQEWSTTSLGAFWETIVAFFNVKFKTPYQEAVRPGVPFYTTQWFKGGKLSYAYHIERHFKHMENALVFCDEQEERIEISWNALFKKADEIKKSLTENGVTKGDCVVGYLRNHPDTIAAFLATNALGAVWSCCSPDFGIESVKERFGPLKPKVLFAHTHYSYKQKTFLLKDKIQALKTALNLEEKAVIYCPGTTEDWDLETEEKIPLNPISVEFNHPIWVLFSSGTTGQPKAITHRTGGMLLEQLKALALHQEVKENDRFFWHTTTGWMMWNYALGSLLCGAELYLYDGAADVEKQWRMIGKHQIHHFGHGAPFFTASEKQKEFTLNKETFTHLKTIGSTGAPLPKRSFIWLKKQLPHTPVISLSGGTDLCSAFLGGCALKPIYAGYLQCVMLGAKIASWNEERVHCWEETGELVLTVPMPSMPLYFWNDTSMQRYHEAYFKKYEGVWAHGDWIAMHPKKGIQVLGRSDATLNRNGIRIGTSEIYNALHQMEEVLDALIVEVNLKKEATSLFLFVVLPQRITPVLEKRIRTGIREKCSPRHVPDRVFQVGEIPRTLSGKKMEIPIKKYFESKNEKETIALGAMKNPLALSDFTFIKQQL